NQQRQQKHSASKPRHTDQDTHHQTDQNLGRNFHYALLSRGRSRINANESLALQMQNDLLGGFFGRQIRGVDDYLGIFWLLIRIRNTSELIHNAGTSLSVMTFAIALLTGFERSRELHLNESSNQFEHTEYLFTNCVI